MGIINVTPDSFADAGKTLDHSQAIDRGLQHINEGADIIDVGGESTRPGSKTINTKLEWKRVKNVIKTFKKILSKN